MRLTASVRGLEPGAAVETPLRLPAGGQRMVYFFTELHGLSGRTVLHRWERNGRVMHQRELRPTSQKWRAYSGMSIASGMQGAWRIAVVDAGSGALLAQTRFTVE